MRRLLVDHARKHNAESVARVFRNSLDENIDRAVERSAELIALDDALKPWRQSTHKRHAWLSYVTSAGSPLKRRQT